MEKNNSEIIIYQTEDGATKINVRLEENSVWLAQSDLVELFQSSKSNISEHIKHIFEEGELDETAVVRKFRTTAPDGKNYNVTFYNLDVIISIGKFWKFTLPALITIPMPKPPRNFSRLFRTNCIGRHMDTLRRKSCLKEPTQKNHSWD